MCLYDIHHVSASAVNSLQARQPPVISFLLTLLLITLMRFQFSARLL